MAEPTRSYPVGVLAWLAFGVSLLALVVAGLSAGYTRRQAVAAEDTVWESSALRFDADVEDPHSGAARLRVLYRAGPPLDDLVIELVDRATSPVSGFGAGTPDTLEWAIGQARVGDEWSKAVVQLPSGSRDGPAWMGGSFRLRFICQRERHRRDITTEVELPPQPWVY